jgi:uncharacterized membrane protein
MRLIIALAVVLLVLPCVYSQEVRDYHAFVTVKGASPFFKNPGEVYEKVTLVFYNTQSTPLREVSYPFVTDSRNVRVYDKSGDLNFSISVRGGKRYVTVPFREPLEPAHNISITYEFGPVRTIQVRGSNSFILTTAQAILANVKNFKLVIFLPAGYVLSPEGAIPHSKDILSDGRSVILIWEMQEPIPAALKGDFKVVVFYERVGWYPDVYQVSIIIVAILGVLVYSYLRRRSSKKKPLKRTDLQEFLKILKEDEQKILRIIIEEDGIDQREIQRLTDFSKTKVSKILAELEKRGVIRKEPYGRKNKVYLSEKLKEVEE